MAVKLSDRESSAKYLRDMVELFISCPTDERFDLVRRYMTTFRRVWMQVHSEEEKK